MKEGFLRPEILTQGRGNTKMNFDEYELRSLNQCYTSILLVIYTYVPVCLGCYNYIRGHPKNIVHYIQSEER